LADDESPIVVKKPFGQEPSPSAAGISRQILYHGGQVLGTNGAAVPVYVIYYGNAFPSTTQPIIDNFIGGISSGVNVTTGTYPFAVNSSYCEAHVTTCPAPGPGSTSISGVLSYVKSVNVTPSTAAPVTSLAVNRILQTALTTGGLP